MLFSLKLCFYILYSNIELALKINFVRSRIWIKTMHGKSKITEWQHLLKKI